MSDAEVLKTAGSAWRYETRVENWRGYRGQGAHVRLDARVFGRLLAEYPRHGPDALALYVTLREKNSARVKRGETFAVAARAMANEVLPWSEYRIRVATKTLVMFGLLERVHDGGTGEGDAHHFVHTPVLGLLLPLLLIDEGRELDQHAAWGFCRCGHKP